MISCKTIGDAKRVARTNAVRDEAEWIVWTDPWSNLCPYLAQPEVDGKPYYDSKKIWSTKEDKPVVPKEHTVILTDEEKELLDFILGDKVGREIYPGTNEVKDSLWSKIKQMV